jgi:predicted Zn-dependent protease
MLKELSVFCLKRGAFQEASEIIRIAGRHTLRTPGNLSFLAVDAEIARQSGRLKRAEALWEQYARERPDDVRAQFAVTELYYRNGRFGKLEEVVGRLLAAKKERTWNSFIEETRQTITESDVYVPLAENLIPVIGSVFKK